VSAGRKGYVARAMRRLASRTDRFVCISEYVRGMLLDHGLPADKLVSIPCGTDTEVEREYPSRLREELNLLPETPVIGSTGIWRPNKGFTFFLAACELVLKSQPLARFLLGGRAYGPDAAFATSLWMRGQLLRGAGALNYTGFQEDVGRFLSALDIFVLPSDCEPFGQVLIEAMVRGIPVVATNAGGAPEIVVHGETGYLVPPRDPEAMAAAINRLLADPLRRMQMGESGKARARRLFDRRDMNRQYQALYQRLLADQVRP
jgi:glycosyltransferase involved in cell wall biosynthesis